MPGRTILVWPDTHVPDHNVKAVNAVLDFVSAYDPDEIIMLGDFIDCLAPARWTRDTAAEFAGTLQAEYDAAYKLLGVLRDVYDGPVGMHKGNHEKRVENYIRTKAPAFSSLRGLRFENELHLKELGISVLPTFNHVSTGWITTHGDAGNLVRTGGGTALSLARKIGYNVVCGHTHRLGIQSETHGLMGKTHTLTGVEAGNLMDIRKADYLSVGSANWQTGFGLLNIHGAYVRPEIVPVSASGVFHV